MHGCAGVGAGMYACGYEWVGGWVGVLAWVDVRVWACMGLWVGVFRFHDQKILSLCRSGKGARTPNHEFSLVFELCQFVLTNSQNTALLVVRSEARPFSRKPLLTRDE